MYTSIIISVFSLCVSQSHGHSHYTSADRYSTPDREVEEGEKEKLQQNGEASSLALGKVDAGEGELMLSPAQTPQVKMEEDGGERKSESPEVVVLVFIHQGCYAYFSSRVNTA